jgi:type VI secretion system secreted protein Hcp
MAMDMFMVLDGIKGEARDKEFGAKGAIDVLAWSWGMSQSGSTHVGSGAGAGKVNVQDISFTKYIDNASTTLMLQCCNGKHVKKAELFCRKAGEKPLVYIHLTLTDLIISSVSTGGSGGEDRLTENVTLNFAKFEFEYYKQKTDGTGEKVGPVSYDIAQNV